VGGFRRARPKADDWLPTHGVRRVCRAGQGREVRITAAVAGRQRRRPQSRRESPWRDAEREPGRYRQATSTDRRHPQSLSAICPSSRETPRQNAVFAALALGRFSRRRGQRSCGAVLENLVANTLRDADMKRFPPGESSTARFAVQANSQGMPRTSWFSPRYGAAVKAVEASQVQLRLQIPDRPKSRKSPMDLLADTHH